MGSEVGGAVGNPAPRLLRLHERRAGAGLVRLRVGLGLIVALSAARLLAYGWVDSLLVAPPYHFAYQGFAWVAPLPAGLMHAWLVLLLLLGLLLAAGVGGRAVAAATFAAFTYVELIDKATWLNHYYLLSVLLLLLTLSSVTRSDAPRLALPRPGSLRQFLVDSRAFAVPAYELFAFRAQVAIVYFCAGLWKLNPDWMQHGEPLTTWLWSFGRLPLVGPLLALPTVGLLMSWAGAAFDLSIWAFLLWRRTAKVAFAVCVGFHVTVWLLFPIGVFSWVMLLSASVLLPEGPPPRPTNERRVAAPEGRWRLPVLGLFLLVQAAVPMRGLVGQEGLRWHDVNWDEDGYRFAWRVMLNEKAADFSLRARDTTHPWRAWPYLDELTSLQARQMSYQPDMILAYAHHVCRQLDEGADVRASSYVAWNGRRAAPLLVDVNLCQVTDPRSIVLPRPQTAAGRH